MPEIEYAVDIWDLSGTDGRPNAEQLLEHLREFAEEGCGLLALVEEDQSFLGSPEHDWSSDQIQHQLLALLGRLRQRLVQILDSYGWPGRSLVGEDGAAAAWTLALHTMPDPDILRRGPTLMRDAAAAGEVEPWQVGFLVDRVSLVERNVQVYGTTICRKMGGSRRPCWRIPITWMPAVGLSGFLRSSKTSAGSNSFTAAPSAARPASGLMLWNRPGSCAVQGMLGLESWQGRCAMAGPATPRPPCCAPRWRTLAVAVLLAAAAGCSDAADTPSSPGSTQPPPAPTGTGTTGPAFDRGRFAAAIPIPGAGSMTVADGMLWVRASGAVVRIDPATNAVVGKPLRVPADAEAIAVSDGALWAARVAPGDLGAPGKDAVTRIELATGRAVATVTVGRAPLDLGVTPGAVWVTNSGGGGDSVARIDPRINRLVGPAGQDRRQPPESGRGGRVAVGGQP
ncbi:MAG: hypothetical protein ACJ782_19690 [Actinomycetota bacterium]